MSQRSVASRASASILIAVLSGGLVLCSAPSAFAASPPPSPSPSASAPSPASTTSAEAASVAEQIQQLGAQLVDLQHKSLAKAKAAQQADERYLKAAAAAKKAQLAALDAQKAASAAAATARASRARAAAVAASLARTDLGTLPLSLLLNGRTADGTLTGLSSASRLSVQSEQVYRQAAVDEATAADAERASTNAAHVSALRSAAARATRGSARHDAAAAAKRVHEQQAKESTLIARLADLRGGWTSDSCAALGDGVPCGSALPTSGVDTTTPGGRVVAFARAQIGDPYVFAAAGPAAWDCSGLTMGAYESLGIGIGPHSATAQYNTALSRGDLVPMADAKPGDLLFYTDGGGDMYHVTIYSGDGMMIEAPYEGVDVREVPMRRADLVPLAAHFS